MYSTHIICNPFESGLNLILKRISLVYGILNLGCATICVASDYCKLSALADQPEPQTSTSQFPIQIPPISAAFADNHK